MLHIRELRQKGQSLVEMIIVIGVVVLLTSGIVIGTTVALNRSKTSQNRSDALSYAQDGLEIARATRDKGWAAFSVKGNPISKDTTAGPLYTRSVTYELTSIAGVPTMKVTSKVIWGDTANPNNKVELTTYLTQWK